MKRILLIIVIVIALFACTRNPLRIDVSDVKIDLTIRHLEVDLLSDTTRSIGMLVPMLQEKYDDFFELFNHQMIRIGGADQENYLDQLSRFVKDTMIQKLYSDVDRIIDTVSVREQLVDAFKHYRYFFPKKSIPAIYTCISGFNQSVVVADSLVGISLDKYLGSDCSYYSMLGIPEYKRKNMHSEKIVPDVCYAFAMAEFPKLDGDDNLISYIIYEGKLMYFVGAMLPSIDDSLKMGYSEKQLNYCHSSEGAMWTYLAEHQSLFTTDRMNIKRFIDNAPFTNAFTNQSPGRTGVWIGWQIIRSYMKKNTEITLSELMENQDYRSILSLSGYQPQ